MATTSKMIISTEKPLNRHPCAVYRFDDSFKINGYKAQDIKTYVKMYIEWSFGAFFWNERSEYPKEDMEKWAAEMLIRLQDALENEEVIKSISEFTKSRMEMRTSAVPAPFIGGDYGERLQKYKADVYTYKCETREYIVEFLLTL
jgi:hypothetical protein